MSQVFWNEREENMNARCDEYLWRSRNKIKVKCSLVRSFLEGNERGGKESTLAVSDPGGKNQRNKTLCAYLSWGIWIERDKREKKKLGVYWVIFNVNIPFFRITVYLVFVFYTVFQLTILCIQKVFLFVCLCTLFLQFAIKFSFTLFHRLFSSAPYDFSVVPGCYAPPEVISNINLFCAVSAFCNNIYFAFIFHRFT